MKYSFQDVAFVSSVGYKQKKDIGEAENTPHWCQTEIKATK
jgi:hypothetical protein